MAYHVAGTIHNTGYQNIEQPSPPTTPTYHPPNNHPTINRPPHTRLLVLKCILGGIRRLMNATQLPYRMVCSTAAKEATTTVEGSPGSVTTSQMSPVITGWVTGRRLFNVTPLIPYTLSPLTCLFVARWHTIRRRHNRSRHHHNHRSP